MKNIENQKIIWIKGILFLLTGLLSALMLIIEAPNIRVVMLLSVSIWAFCRFYYFMFYVIEKYTNSNYRYSGLISFFLYIIRR